MEATPACKAGAADSLAETDDDVRFLATKPGAPQQLTAPALPDLAAVAERIRARLQRHVKDMVAIGADLLVVKAKLPHGEFGSWLDREFGLGVRTAQLYMRAAEWAEGKSEIISQIPPPAIRLLSAPTTPEPIQNEVVEAIRAGAAVNYREVEEQIREHRANAAQAKREQLRKEARLRGKSPEYQKQLERQMAREAAKNRREAEERERLVAEARVIIQRLSAEDLGRLRAISDAVRWIYLSELVEGLLNAPADVQIEVTPEPPDEPTPVETDAPAPTGLTPGTTQWEAAQDAWEQIAARARPRDPKPTAAPEPPEEDLRGKLERALDHLQMSRERFAGHARQHARPQANLTEGAISKFVTGGHVSYHVRDAIQAALDELADYAGARP
jgi:hypothetical protein